MNLLYMWNLWATSIMNPQSQCEIISITEDKIKKVLDDIDSGKKSKIKLAIELEWIVNLRGITKGKYLFESDDIEITNRVNFEPCISEYLNRELSTIEKSKIKILSEALETERYFIQLSS